MVASDYDAWSDIYDAVYSYVTEDIPFYITEALAVGGDVLELGCGTGRVAIPVAKAIQDAGGTVTGIDSSPAMLERAHRKADRARTSNLSLIQADMRDFTLNRRFDLITIPFRGFQALLSVEDEIHALQNIKHHLAPSGRLVFDIFVPDTDMLAQDSDVPFHFHDVVDPSTGRRMVIWLQTAYDQFTQTLDTRAIIEELDEHGAVQRRLYRDFRLRCVHRWEMQHLLSVCGYETLALYGDFDRSVFQPDSNDMIWVEAPTPHNAS